MTQSTISVDVAIIGAGFGGLGVAIALKKKRINNFILFEGQEDVGGSWRTNTYPGCACDVPSHLYSYSFETNPQWPEAYSRQIDIQHYIEQCADKYRLRSNIRFNTHVTDARFDAQRGIWLIHTDDNVVTEARVLVPATGALSHPKYPDIKGIDRFGGVSLHTARWQPNVELKNKRIGVIGTGASAIQVIPAIADGVAKLQVFQRTPAWVLPKNNRHFLALEQQRWHEHPILLYLKRIGIYWLMESALPALMWFPSLLKMGERLHRKNLHTAIKDPELRRQLTPDYHIGCKRALLADDYFPTFTRKNVHLVTEPIEEITTSGVKTRDGCEHELDILIHASGYEIGQAAYPFEIHGMGGRTLSSYWGEQRRAYYGMTVSHFPNMLLIMGPNTGPGHTSVLIYQEAQYRYVANYTQYLLSRELSYLDVKEDMQDAQFEQFQKRMKNSTWLSGCQSWYLNKDGTNSTMWPGFSFEYVLRTRQLHINAFNAVTLLDEMEAKEH